MLDGTKKIILLESNCIEAPKGAATISYGPVASQSSVNQKNIMHLSVFVGYICRICRKGLCLLVLGGVRHAKH